MIKKNMSLKIANTVALAATVLVNILANALPLGGLNTGQISAMYPTLFTPPGFTFAIWGVIYSLLAVFVAVQLFMNTLEDTAEIGIYFVLSCILNIAWIFTWHNQMIILSTIIIIALLWVLMQIYNSTRNGHWLTKATFSIYFAWITVATMISLFVLVKTLTGNAPVTPIQARNAVSPAPGYTDIIIVGGDPEIVSYVSVLEYIMAAFAIAVTTGLAMLHIIKNRDYVYAGTALWAMGGIMYKQFTAPVQPMLMLIVGVLAVAAIVYAIAIREMTFSNYRRHNKYASLKHRD